MPETDFRKLSIFGKKAFCNILKFKSLFYKYKRELSSPLPFNGVQAEITIIKCLIKRLNVIIKPKNYKMCQRQVFNCHTTSLSFKISIWNKILVTQNQWDSLAVYTLAGVSKTCKDLEHELTPKRPLFSLSLFNFNHLNGLSIK